MPYSASIFIWYPDEKKRNIGHCSMYIGDLFSGARYNPAMSTDSITRDNFAESCGIFDVDWPNDPDYVSWWPHVFISSTYLLRNTTTRLWAETGTRPRAIQQKQFKNAYLTNVFNRF